MHLVIGATGALGSRVAARLLRRGHPVRVVSRQASRLAAFAAAGAEAQVGDLLDPVSLAGALAGVQTVTLAAHGLVPISRVNHPEAVDGAGARDLVEAAAAAGVSRFVHLSVRQADARHTVFARIKHDTENHLVRTSKGTALRHTILRPSLFMENHALLLLGEPLRASQPVRFLGRGQTPLNWVSADDVAELAVEALEDPEGPSQILEVDGPDTMTRLEALALLETALGRSARRSHLPLPVVRMLRATLGRLNRGLGVLLDLAVQEEASPGAGSATLRPPDRVGSTHLTDVAERWARETS